MWIFPRSSYLQRLLAHTGPPQGPVDGGQTERQLFSCPSTGHQSSQQRGEINSSRRQYRQGSCSDAPKPAPMLVYQTARANKYQNEIGIKQNYCLKQNQACSPIQTHLSVFSRKKKKHTQHLLNYSDFFLLLSLLVQAKALKSHEAHWSCAISHLILKHLKLMGKVILITSLPEQIWSAQMNIQALQSPAYHTLLFPLGQILPGYTEPPGWHSLKDTKCPLKGDKAKIEWNQEELQLDCYRGSCHNL